MSRKPVEYYLIPNLLSDVIRMISVLAVVERYNFQDEKSLHDSLEDDPNSAKTWMEIAEEHPEFFRFNKERTHVILLFRFINKRHIERKEVRPPLEIEQVQWLIDHAVEYYDKQLASSQRNSYKATIWSAYITAAATIVTALIALYSSSDVKSDIKDLNVQIEKLQHQSAKSK